MYLSHSVSVSLARVRDWSASTTCSRYRAVDQNQTEKVDFLWRFSSLQDCVSQKTASLSLGVTACLVVAHFCSIDASFAVKRLHLQRFMAGATIILSLQHLKGLV